MAAQPVALPELLIGEIIHCVPPDDPAWFFRAQIVSQAWRDFLTNPDLSRRYREFHGAPPVLGFVQNTYREDNVDLCFFPTTTPSPRIGMLRFPPRSIPLALDCRHGRVLVHTIQPFALNVWNPITNGNGNANGLQELPPCHAWARPMSYYAGAVLCAADACDHLQCGGGAFRVVFVATANTDAEAAFDIDIDEVFTWGSVYSSATNSWTEPTTVHPGPLMIDPVETVMGPSLLAGGALYFTLDLENSRTILRYDLDNDALSVMDPPPLHRRDMFLVTAEDGGLGVAAGEDYCLRLWAWRDAAWAPWRTIDLGMIVPLTIGDPTTVLEVIGFAEMSRVIFVSASGVISTIELRSGRVREVGRTLDFNPIFPFESFYTPGMTVTVAGAGAREGECKCWGEFLTLSISAMSLATSTCQRPRLELLSQGKLSSTSSLNHIALKVLVLVCRMETFSDKSKQRVEMEGEVS